ncbi:hypothetical protein HK405_013515 [Cladochytrium tenue]|nr:hypothetical protein HK405_013515 [Cladochytrium tenue]
MFAGRNAAMLKPDQGGEFFFDRSAACFEAVLAAYRTGVVACPPNVPQPVFERELLFWGIDPPAPPKRRWADLPAVVAAPSASAGNTSRPTSTLAPRALALVRTLLRANPSLLPASWRALDTAAAAATRDVPERMTVLEFGVDLDGAVDPPAPAAVVRVQQARAWLDSVARMVADASPEPLQRASAAESTTMPSSAGVAGSAVAGLAVEGLPPSPSLSDSTAMTGPDAYDDDDDDIDADDDYDEDPARWLARRNLADLQARLSALCAAAGAPDAVRLDVEPVVASIGLRGRVGAGLSFVESWKCQLTVSQSVTGV